MGDQFEGGKVGWERVEGDPDESADASQEGEAWDASDWEAEEPYRPLERRAKIVLGLLAAGITIDAVAIVSGLMERSLLADAERGKVLTQAEADRSDLRELVVAVVQGGVFVLTAVAFLFWFYRAYRNLTALGAPNLRHRYGWAVGAWFVPILNLWRPKQIANDVWRGSDPELPPGRWVEWGSRPVPAVFLVWWLAYLAMGWLYSFSARRAIAALTLDELRDANTLYLAADIVSIVAGALALVVVVRTTRRQAARARRLGLVPEEETTSLWRRRSAWAALVATLLGFGLHAGLAAASWSGALDPEESAPTAEPPANAPAGTLLGDDFSREGVWLVENNRAYTFDYVGASYRILLKEPGMYTSGQALFEEAEALTVEADATLHAGRVRTDFYGVACLTASRGSYLFGISADGYYTIGVDPGGDQSLEFNRLLEDWSDRRFGRDEETLRIRAGCAIQDDDTIRLTLAVNDTRVAETSHRGPREALAGVEVFAYSEDGGTDVRFDNLLARDATDR